MSLQTTLFAGASSVLEPAEDGRQARIPGRAGDPSPYSRIQAIVVELFVMNRRDLAMDRRNFVGLGAAASVAGLASGLARAEAVLGDDGLHKQPFFFDSFLELGVDLEDAAAEGKGLIVLFEQRGCPYCRELHEVNFEREEITGFIESKYVVVQLDLWGARAVVDFDGEELEERDLARKWFVNFTPTQIIFPARNAGAADFRQAEGFRLPGYFKPFHHLAGLEYVSSGAYREQPFQRFLQDRFAALEAQGIDPDVW